MAFAAPPAYGSLYFNPTVWDINNSPVTQAELALKAPKSNPIFSGTISATGGGTLSGTFTGNTTWSGTNLFNSNTTFGASSNIIQVAGSQILQAPASTGYTDNNVLNITTIRTANTAVTNTASFQIADTLNSSFLTFNPAATNNYYDTIVQANDFAIAIANTPLAITHFNAPATNGIRLQSDKLLLGFGGSVDIPTNNITFNQAAGIVVTSSFPPTSSALQPVATDSTAAMPTTAWVQTAITAAPAKIPINSNNSDGTYYPTFTASTGTKTELLIDDVTGPFSYNPVTGDFKVGQSLNITTTAIDCKIAIGKNAGLSQAGAAVAIGFQAGQSVQGINTVALGIQAGNQNQGADSVAVGVNAGYILQGSGAIAIGSQTAWNRQGVDAVAIGHFAGQGSTPGLLVTDFQGSEAVAIGMSAGRLVQGIKSVAMGHNAGLNRQGTRSVAIGNLAASGTSGSTTDFQGADSVAIGPNAGQFVQAIKSVAIGHEAGINRQGGSIGSAIAIGNGAGKGTIGSTTDFQGANAIAIGQDAGTTQQGANAIAIGQYAGQSTQTAKSICLNGSGTALVANQEGFFVKPIRTNATVQQVLQYDSTSGEISYKNFPTNGGYVNQPNRITTITAGTTAITNTNFSEYYLCQTTAGNITLQIPNPATTSDGMAIQFRSVGSVTYTLTLSFTGTMGCLDAGGINQTSILVPANGSYRIVVNSAAWYFFI